MRAWAIAINTFREAVRDRVFVLVGAFGFLLVVSSVFLSPLTVGAQQKIVADIGLAAISIFSVLVILFVGTGMVYKEIDKRSIMVLLSKPITRMEYLLGKYLGLLLTLLTMMASMFALFMLALFATGTTFQVAYLSSLLMSVMEVIVMTAVVIFFSSFTTPVLTSLFTLGLFLTGRMLEDLEAFSVVSGAESVDMGVTIVKFIIPHLDLFNVRNAAVHGLPIEGGHLLWACIYALVYSGALLVLSDLIFKRREFK
jgi:ABC-type transport system involved in multi-copper enzyme maturation permease subunit